MSFGVSASTIKGWFQYRCPRKTKYDLMPEQALKDASIQPDRRVAAWARLGDHFEKRVLDRLRQHSSLLAPPIGQERLGQAQTAAFLAGNRTESYAAQASLESSRAIRRLFGLAEDMDIRRSYPDLISIDRSGPEPIFTIIDIKATRKPTPFHMTQVAFYCRLLRAMLDDLGAPGRINDSGEIWVIHEDSSPADGIWQPHIFPLGPYLRLVDDFFKNEVPEILAQAIEADRDESFFHLYFKCEQCEYLRHCRKSIDPPRPPGSRDLSAVPGMSHEAKRVLLRRGITTVQALATSGNIVQPGVPTSWNLQRRAELLRHRAQAQLSGDIRRLPEVYSYLMPPQVDVALHLSADFDPVDGTLVTIGYLRCQNGRRRSIVKAIDDSSPDAECRALIDVLGALISDLEEIDAHNAAAEQAGASQLHAHIFVYEPAEAKYLQQALGRHLEDHVIRTGLLHAIRLFPPEDVVPEPEFRGRPPPYRPPPCEACSSNSTPFRQWYSYDLRQVSQAIGPTRLSSVYDPQPPFARDFSSLLSMEVIRGLRHREEQIPLAPVEADVLARLHAGHSLTEWLLAENRAAAEPFLRLRKKPFRLQQTLNPLNAGDLDLLHAYELLESRSALLETLVRLAKPLRQRQASRECLGELTLVDQGRNANGRQYWMLFQIPPECRDSEISPDDIGLILTNDDPDIRLDPRNWPNFSISFDYARQPDRIFVRISRTIFESGPFQAMLRANSRWVIDRAFKDLNGPRAQRFLRYLDDTP